MAHVAVTPTTWGRVWHAPSNAARTQRQALTDICASVGRPAPKVASIPGPLLSVLSALSATMREVAAMRYQFDAPFVMDSSAALNELGLAPTPGTRCVAGPPRGNGRPAGMPSRRLSPREGVRA